MPLVMGSNFFKERSRKLKLTEKRKKCSRDSSDPIKQISTKCPLLLVSYYVYIIIGKTWKSRNLIFHQTKEIKISFFMCNLAFSNCQVCDNCISKRPVLEEKVCLKDNGVCAYMHVQLHVIPGQAWCPITKRGFFDRLGTAKVLYELQHFLTPAT